MKAKILFITTLLILQGSFLFSQCISIELSVIWEMESDIFQEDSIVNVPKLNIIYRNNCSENYYFLKLYTHRYGLPWFPCNIMHNLPLDSKGIDFVDRLRGVKLYNKDQYAKQNFNVRIHRKQCYGTLWYIDTGFGGVSCTLQAIYHCINHIFNHDKLAERTLEIISSGKPLKGCFEPSDTVPENILGSLREQFVFLKPGEAFVDTFNLIGFQMIEGCYTFIIEDKDIKNYLIQSEFDEKKKKSVRQELELPEIVGDYKRYVGKFHTNTVTVCFGEEEDRGED